VEYQRLKDKKTGRTGSRALLGLSLLVVLLVGVSGCTCTAPNCGDFAITSPKDGSTLPPGDVKVSLNGIKPSFCTFGPASYEISLDGGAPQKIAASGDLSATFRNVGPGDHAAKAVALDSRGTIVGTAAVRFKIAAGSEPVPVAAPPAPTSTPTPSSVAPAPEMTTSGGQPVSSGYLEDVFFDYDKSEIREDQKDALARDAAWLKKYPASETTVEGHCDERGTREYNLALGERRASAAKEYLVSLGIDATRIKTISYGKERPFAEGSTEEAWAKNRRGHFVVTKK
jgi:peptidoglycan-associated lipoprotein